MRHAVLIAKNAAPIRNSSSATRVLQRQCKTCGTLSLGMSSECEGCKKRRCGRLQTKLRIGSSGDVFELEADCIADQVMNALPRNPHHADAGSAFPVLQRLAPGAPSGSAEVPAIVDDVLRSPGQPLDKETRAFFEPRFGYDFNRIRVHTDATAAESARAVGATAYTVGEHIVFESAQFAPRTQHGRRLLAHELTHTIQQRGSDALAQSARPVAVGGIGPYLARQPKAEPSNEEWEVIAGEKTPDPSDQPWFMFYDKGERRVLLPAGARVESLGAPVPDVRRTAAGKPQRVLLRPVRVLSIPNKDSALARAIGKRGMILAKFVVAVHAPAPKATSKPVAEERDPLTLEASTQQEPESPKKELARRVVTRYRALPDKVKWPWPMWAQRKRSRKTDTQVRMMLTARDFSCSEPYDTEAALQILERVKRFVDTSLTDSNFDKHYGHMSGFAKGPLRTLMNLGAGSVKSITGKIRSGQVGGGRCGGTWDAHLGEFVAAYEVMAVLAGDLDIKEAKNIRALDDLTSFKGAQAFLSGLLEGAKSELSDEDYKRLASKLGDSTLLSALAPPIIIAGATVGIGKDIVDALKGVYELVTSPVEMIKNMAQLIGILMTDEEGSRALGAAIGAQEAKKLREMSKEDIVTFTYKLGEKVGPTVVYTVLSIVTAGAVGGAAYSAKLAAFMEKFPKIAKQINRIKELLPERKKVKADVDLPDAPTPKSSTAPSGPSAKAGAGQPTPPAGEKARSGKRFSDAEAKGLKVLAKDPKNVRKVTDKKLLDEGYQLEIPSGKHIYRRKADGTWCRFGSKVCGFTLDEDDDAAFLRALAKRERAIAAGWAIEDYVAGLGYTRPKAFNFVGIDGWKRGRVRGRNVIADADVIQVKGVSSLKHSNVSDVYDKGVKGLLRDSWGGGDLKVVNPNSRTLHILFDQDTYSNLSLRQQEEMNKLLRTLSGLKQKPPIEVHWYYFSNGRKFRISL